MFALNETSASKTKAKNVLGYYFDWHKLYQDQIYDNLWG
jgi:hypothetical protein